MKAIYDPQVTSNLQKSYDIFLAELRDDSMEHDDTSYLSEDFVDEFKIIILRPELNQWSSHNFYWLNLIDELVDTIDITESFEQEELTLEDTIDYLEKSEFLKMFIDRQDENPAETLKEIIQIKELQIISFFHLHINTSKKWQPGGPVAYRPVYEFNENERSLVLGHQKIVFTLPPDLYQGFLPITSYDPKSHLLTLDYEDEVIECRGNPDRHLVITKKEHPEQKIIILDNQDNVSSDVKSKLTKAFHILEKYTPNLYRFVFDFTTTVTPIHEQDVVSYSMDTLPGHSCINLFDRDLIDLVDDLVHESGHHYLNAILEGEDELIFEDDEKIFYSPWRKTERPIRGLYHAVCTFYWAFVLFDYLSESDAVEDFSHHDIKKIRYRHAEESTMLINCKKELKKGRELGKITPFGYELALNMMKDVESKEKNVQRSLEFLKSHDMELFSKLTSS